MKKSLIPADELLPGYTDQNVCVSVCKCVCVDERTEGRKDDELRD